MQGLSKRTVYVPLVIIVFFSIVFSLISVPNHFFFRTYALDLGMFNQALYQYSIGQWAVFSQGLNGQSVNYLSDHFSPIIILFSPFRYIFGTYTLLVFQIVSGAIAGWYCYKLALLRGLNETLCAVILFHFYSLWGLYSAFAYDFHANVFGAFLLFPFLYYALKENKWKALFCLFLVLISKENMAVVVCAISLVVLFIEFRSSNRLNRILLWSSIVSIFYFLIVTIVVMPTLNNGQIVSSVQSTYGQYGKNLGEVFVHFLSHPFQVIQSILLDNSGEFAKTKITSLFFLLVSGGFLIVIRPIFLIAFIPIIAQKFLSSNTLMWDIHKQYSIELCVVLSLLVIFGVSTLKWEKFKLPGLSLLAGLALYYSIREVVRKSDEANIFSGRHYTSNINSAEVDKIKEIISEVDVISVSSNLAPHLSFRSLVYAFPNLGESEHWVLTKNDFVKSFGNSKNDQEGKENLAYEMLFEGETVVLLRRK